MNSRLLLIGLTAFSVEAQKYVCRFSRQPFPLIFIPTSPFHSPPRPSLAQYCMSWKRRKSVLDVISQISLPRLVCTSPSRTSKHGKVVNRFPSFIGQRTAEDLIRWALREKEFNLQTDMYILWYRRTSDMAIFQFSSSKLLLVMHFITNYLFLCCVVNSVTHRLAIINAQLTFCLEYAQFVPFLFRETDTRTQASVTLR